MAGHYLPELSNNQHSILNCYAIYNFAEYICPHIYTLVRYTSHELRLYQITFQRSQLHSYVIPGSMHQVHEVVSFLFDGHLTVIFGATKLPRFLVLPISIHCCTNGSLYQGDIFIIYIQGSLAIRKLPILLTKNIMIPPIKDPLCIATPFQSRLLLPPVSFNKADTAVLT